MDIIDKNIGQAGLDDEVNTDAKQQAVTIPDQKSQGTTDPEISQPQWQATSDAEENLNKSSDRLSPMINAERPSKTVRVNTK